MICMRFRDAYEADIKESFSSNLLIWGYFTMLCLVIIAPLGNGLAAAVELTTTSTGTIAQI